jgi:hypothetical protein
MALVEEKLVRFEFECRVNEVDVHACTLTYESQSGVSTTKQ